MMVYSYTSLSDLKNRARKIAREQALSRHDALDAAARLGGLQNYAHARRHLPETAVPVRHLITLRQRWVERETRRRGTAQIQLSLKTLLGDLVKPHQLIEYLGGCSIADPGLLLSDGMMRDRRDSQHDLARIGRVLQFMDATGLKPSRAHKMYPKGKWDNRPPIADHDSGWYDPEARTHILVTQPYQKTEVMERADHRTWEQRHDWVTLHTDWGSIYGHGTAFFLLCPAGYAPTLRQKLALLEQSPAAITHEVVDPGDEVVARAA